MAPVIASAALHYTDSILFEHEALDDNNQEKIYKWSINSCFVK